MKIHRWREAEEAIGIQFHLRYCPISRDPKLRDGVGKPPAWDDPIIHGPSLALDEMRPNGHESLEFQFSTILLGSFNLMTTSSAARTHRKVAASLPVDSRFRPKGRTKRKYSRNAETPHLSRCSIQEKPQN
jgi:hypothetical protein